MGSDITNFINYHKENISIIAFNKKSEITSYDLKAMESFLDNTRIISSLIDEKLGRKIVLFIENKDDIHFDSLKSYEKPKEVFYNIKIKRTSNGKLLRKETLEIFLEDYGKQT